MDGPYSDPLLTRRQGEDSPGWDEQCPGSPNWLRAWVKKTIKKKAIHED